MTKSKAKIIKLIIYKMSAKKPSASFIIETEYDRETLMGLYTAVRKELRLRRKTESEKKYNEITPQKIIIEMDIREYLKWIEPLLEVYAVTK